MVRQAHHECFDRLSIKRFGSIVAWAMPTII